MSTTTAQRRGKPPKAEMTVLVEAAEDDAAVENASIGSNQPAVAVATVYRRSCGTGPFDRTWLNLDCCGIFCALFTYCLHIYGVYAVCLVLLPPWMSITADDGVRSLSVAGLIHSTCFTSIAAMAIISHFKAMTTDPGAVPPDAKPVADDSGVIHRLCRRCKSYKPQRAHHCSICRRCIVKMDHHCPWVNNCVGIGNHKYFLLFVFYTFLSCTYSMLLVIIRFSTCMSATVATKRAHMAGAAAVEMQQHHGTCLDRPTHLLTILGLLIEALLFGMFTSCMMCDQATVIHSKVTHIDRLKGETVGGSLSGIAEVFGKDSRFRLDWLSPFVKVCFPSGVADEVMGFCRPRPDQTETVRMSNPPTLQSVDDGV